MKINKIKCLLSVAMAAGISAMSYAEEYQLTFEAIPELPIGNELFSDDSSIPEIDQSQIVARAPAPPLDYVSILAVYSTNCGWENTEGKFTTSCNHGGSTLRAAVLDMGYGSNRIAWMDGSILPNSAIYLRENICAAPLGGLQRCTSGQTVIAFMTYYNLDGYTDGIFQYQNTSTNAPFNTEYDDISIY